MKTQKEYSSMTLYELYHAMQNANKYEMRMIHKALKKYGDGVPLMYRYPDLPHYFLIAALAVALVGAVLKVLL